jgi:hypothetical protein
MLLEKLFSFCCSCWWCRRGVKPNPLLPRLQTPIFVGYLTTSTVATLYMVEWMTDEWWTGKSSEGSCHGLIETLSCNLSGRTEDNNEHLGKDSIPAENRTKQLRNMCLQLCHYANRIVPVPHDRRDDFQSFFIAPFVAVTCRISGFFRELPLPSIGRQNIADRSLFWESYETHKHILRAECRGV